MVDAVQTTKEESDHDLSVGGATVSVAHGAASTTTARPATVRFLVNNYPRDLRAFLRQRSNRAKEVITVIRAVREQRAGASD